MKAESFYVFKHYTHRTCAVKSDYVYIKIRSIMDYLKTRRKNEVNAN
ncbi:hypothetical protein GMMP15_670007 [Candidatus Magnetomoraceae bacterium gMMP-15]